MLLITEFSMRHFKFCKQQKGNFPSGLQKNQVIITHLISVFFLFIPLMTFDAIGRALDEVPHPCDVRHVSN
jgi:hypothetical protein